VLEALTRRPGTLSRASVLIERLANPLSTTAKLKLGIASLRESTRLQIDALEREAIQRFSLAAQREAFREWRPPRLAACSASLSCIQRFSLDAQREAFREWRPPRLAYSGGLDSLVL
jgi:hypothetical protein